YVFQSQKRMAQMIEHAEVENVVKKTEPLRRQFFNIDDGVFNFRSAQPSHYTQLVVLHAIDGHYICATPLALKTIPARGRTNIEDTPPAQILGQRIPIQPGL